MSEKCTIHILTNVDGVDYVQEPAIVEGITWETSRRGEPGKLTFTCLKDRTFGGVSVGLSGVVSNQEFVDPKDGGLSFSEGAEVVFRYGDKKVFSGFVFEKKRNKDHHIEVTCYDRFRYMKNKCGYVFSGLRADQIISRVAQDLGIRLGQIENTQYVIPKYAMDDCTYFDVMQNALDLTCRATKEIYTMYDDYGKICVKHLRNMLVKTVIDADSCEDFDYSTSIDNNTYNRIIVKGDEETGEPVMVEDNSTQKKWGVLTTVVDNKSGLSNSDFAKKYLELCNRVGRSLSIKHQQGDIDVRGGSCVYLELYLGDHTYKQTMVVDKVTHTFDQGEHYMDLTLIDGRDFYA